MILVGLLVAAAVLVSATFAGTKLDRRSKAHRAADRSIERRLIACEQALRRIANGSPDPSLEASLALDTLPELEN